MAAAHGLLCTWLENGPEFHPACCQRHVPAHSAALVVLTRSASHPNGSPVVTQRARIVPKATTSTAYIPCFGQVDLSIWVAIDQHTTSATSHRQGAQA